MIFPTMGDLEGSCFIYELGAHLWHTSKAALLADGATGFLACSKKLGLRCQCTLCQLRRSLPTASEHSVVTTFAEITASFTGFELLLAGIGLRSLSLRSAGDSGRSKLINFQLFGL